MSDDTGEQLNLDDIMDGYADSDSDTIDERTKDGEYVSGTDRVETSIGVMPNDWGVKHLREICNINPDGFSEDNWNGETFEYISLSDVSEGEILQSQTIPLDEAPSRAQREIKAGDVLVGTVRPKQISHGLVTEEHNGKVCSSGFGVLRTESNLNGFYLLQEVLSHRFFRQMEAYVAGSGYPAVKIGDLKKHRIGVPPLPEQRKIASILYNVDRAIQKTEEVIQQSNVLKKGVMQDLFTEGYRDHDKYKEVYIGPKKLEIPGEWEFKEFDEFATKVKDGPHITPDYVEDGIPFISSQNVSPFREKFDFESYEKYISEETYKEINNNCRPEKGDLLISRRATIGPTQLLRSNKKFGYFVGVAIIKTDEQAHNPYLEQLLNWSEIQKLWHAKSPGSTMNTLNLGTIKAQKVPLPPIEEQIKIAESLYSIDRVRITSEEKKERFNRLKRGLMQDLLTGKVRTTSLDINVLPEVEKYG